MTSRSVTIVSMAQISLVNCRSSDSRVWYNARVFNRCGTTQAVAHDISNVFDRVLLVGLLHKLHKSHGTSGQVFDLILPYFSNKQLRVVLDWKSLQEDPSNAGVSQDSIFTVTFFSLYFNDLPDDVISNIAIYAYDTTLSRSN